MHINLPLFVQKILIWLGWLLFHWNKLPGSYVCKSEFDKNQTKDLRQFQGAFPIGQTHCVCDMQNLTRSDYTVLKIRKSVLINVGIIFLKEVINTTDCKILIDALLILKSTLFYLHRNFNLTKYAFTSGQIIAKITPIFVSIHFYLLKIWLL